MNENETKTSQILLEGMEDDGEYSLRPQTLKEFIGQEKIKEQLRIHIEAAKKRKQALEHILFVGPPGLGKTTLARIIANEMGTNFKPSVGTTIEKLHIASILTNLEAGDVFFVDEIHAMRAQIQESMYPAMEDYMLDLSIGTGPSARVVQMPLSRFTLVGATTREGLLAGPFRDRFGIRIHLDYYTPEEIQIAINHYGEKMRIEIEPEAERELALRARGTMRIAQNLLRIVRDYATVKGDGIVTHEIADEALAFYNVDELGLDDRDREYLKVLIDNFGGRAGRKALAVSLSEDERTIEEVYEPYLIKIGFLTLTPMGRVATEHAYEHLGYELPDYQPRLW